MKRRELMVMAALAMTIGAWALTATASKRSGNRPYVQSGATGIFYARCLPAAATGPSGTTTVHRVEAAGDVVIERYDFYPPGSVTLAWSPVAGQVALLAVMNDRTHVDDWAAREELRFCLGGKVLKRYTAGELVALGADDASSRPGGRHAVYRVVGSEQVPGTNEYDFIIELGQGKRLRFDILTGLPREEPPR